VAGHRLIDAHLDALARRLPGDAVDELADGLSETFQRRLDLGLPVEVAARSAIAEFGAVDVIVAAFVRQAPGRLAARALLASGPVVGVCWAAAMVTDEAWTWPVPGSVRVAFGAALVTVVVALALAATARRSYRRTRIASFAGLALLALDTGALACVALARPDSTVAVCLAAVASLTRVSLTVRTLPKLLKH
jgi:hypothetical protein